MTESNGSQRIKYGCCFCGNEIVDISDDCMVTACVGEWEQTWWCHRDCFETALHQGFRIFTWRGETV